MQTEYRFVVNRIVYEEHVTEQDKQNFEEFAKTLKEKLNEYGKDGFRLHSFASRTNGLEIIEMVKEGPVELILSDEILRDKLKKTGTFGDHSDNE